MTEKRPQEGTPQSARPTKGEEEGIEINSMQGLVVVSERGEMVLRA